MVVKRTTGGLGRQGNRETKRQADRVYSALFAALKKATPGDVRWKLMAVESSPTAC